MPRISVPLDVLLSMPDEHRQEFSAALPAAQLLASRLPLVRVVVPHTGSRTSIEIRDVIQDGQLYVTHKSKGTSDDECTLRVRSGVYFHAGRTHPQYGKLALVIEELDTTSGVVDATPFGLGGLLCKGSVDDRHPDRCMDPVAHALVDDQVDFVARATWHADWRERTAEFIAAYFGHGSADWFAAPGVVPKYGDPAGVFKGTCRDWRAWTVEVRVCRNVDLHEVIRQDRLLWWAMDDELYHSLLQRLEVRGKAHVVQRLAGQGEQA